jgi:hypothetical protein
MMKINSVAVARLVRAAAVFSLLATGACGDLPTSSMPAVGPLPGIDVSYWQDAAAAWTYWFTGGPRGAGGVRIHRADSRCGAVCGLTVTARRCTFCARPGPGWVPGPFVCG